MAAIEEAPIRTYRDLLTALDRQRKKLGQPMLAVDFATGLADGHTAKILCGVRSLGPISLGLLLEAFGVELILRPRINSENERDQAA